jgi:hypothetical protein
MNSYVERTPLSKALMTGLFTGLVSTIVSLFYNIFFRLSTGFPLPEIVNVSSIIFVINLIFVFIGLFYFFIHRISARGDLIYLVITVAGTLIVLWLVSGMESSQNSRYVHDFKGLLAGIFVIMSINAFLIPFLIKKKWFEDFFL